MVTVEPSVILFPNYVTRYNANVTLYEVKTHHGTQYFAKMKISAHGHRTIWATMRGGSWG
jgi:hypothetical protein